MMDRATVINLMRYIRDVCILPQCLILKTLYLCARIQIACISQKSVIPICRRANVIAEVESQPAYLI